MADSPAEPAVRVAGVTHRYGERTALDEVSFEAPPGEFLALLGPNGSGKTTLFRILTTVLLPSAGEARVGGHSTAREPAAVRRRIGVVFQTPALDGLLTVRENLRHQAALHGLPADGRIDRELERFGVLDRADDPVDELSGGLARRVELAKAMIPSPSILLMDEPSAGLDPGARRDLRATLGRLREAGVTVLVTTHLMDVADPADRVVILDEGSVVAEGRPDGLRSEIGGDVVTIETDDPEGLGERIRERFGDEPTCLDGTVRVERPEGHAFVPRVVEAFPGEIGSITLAEPSLEDVFMRRTGHAFEGRGSS